jgi:4-hydroxythreonine-4-phosphate dehydrogenase
MIRAVFTCGDVNGIGPEIALKAFKEILSKKNSNQIIFICPKNVFEFYYKQTKSNFNFSFIKDSELPLKNSLNIIPLNNVKIHFGKITASSGKISYYSILKAIDLVKNRKADVIVTSPVSKEAINKSGIKFSGHTELLARRDGSKDFLMMFLSNDLKAALLTIHQPLKKISSLITSERIIKAVEIIYQSAKTDFGITDPKIAILGLNPHSGENGLIGDEEVKIILPAKNRLNKKFKVDGPFVPDAFWGSKKYKKYNFTLGMYHDQLLIPFKMLHFNSGVNFTAGLNIIRTSPDHGTAFDIAGKNIADPESLIQSYKYAINIFRNRKNYFASKETN